MTNHIGQRNYLNSGEKFNLQNTFFFLNWNEQEHFQLRSAFQSQQWKFDKLLKQCKNKFAMEQQVLIESRIHNSKQFWSSLKQLLPNNNKTNIPLKVYTSEGVLSDGIKVVLN